MPFSVRDPGAPPRRLALTFSCKCAANRTRIPIRRRLRIWLLRPPGPTEARKVPLRRGEGLHRTRFRGRVAVLWRRRLALRGGPANSPARKKSRAGEPESRQQDLQPPVRNCGGDWRPSPGQKADAASRGTRGEQGKAVGARLQPAQPVVSVCSGRGG